MITKNLSPDQTAATSCCGSCGTDDAAHEVTTGIAGSATTTDYVVSGMTCGHCVGSVTDALSALPGVTGVDVDLSTGTVSIASTEALSVVTVREAVAEAGYALATG